MAVAKFLGRHAAFGPEKLIKRGFIGIADEVGDFVDGFVGVSQKEFGIVHPGELPLFLEGHAIERIDQPVQLPLGAVEGLCQGFAGVVLCHLFGGDGKKMINTLKGR